MMLEKLLLFQVWLHLVQAIIDYLQILVIMNQNQNQCLEVDKIYIHYSKLFDLCNFFSKLSNILLTSVNSSISLFFY